MNITFFHPLKYEAGLLRDFTFIGHVVWNVKMAVNYELGKLRKYMVILKVLSHHLCGWHESRLGWLLGKGLNLGPVKYEAGMLSAVLYYSVRWFHISFKNCVYILLLNYSLCTNSIHSQYKGTGSQCHFIIDVLYCDLTLIHRPIYLLVCQLFQKLTDVVT